MAEKEYFSGVGGSNPFGQPPGQDEQFNQYAIFRNFAGVRNTAPVWQIGDNDFSNLTNAMPSDDGNIQSIPGHATSPILSATGGLTISTIQFAYRNSTSFMLVFFSDGSAKEWSFGTNSVDHSWAAGTFCSGPQSFGTTGASPVCTAVTSWEDQITLIIDPVKGYFSWDGATFTTISSTVKGYSIAIHQGRVWIVQGRTIQFTGTNGYNDFNVANGAGAFTTKTDSVTGVIVQVMESTTYLYIMATNAVLVIGSIQFASGLTSFAVQVLVDGVGQLKGTTSISMNGIPIVMSPLGIFGMTSSQPELISDDLRGTYGSYNLGIGPTSSSAGFIFANGLIIPVFLVGNPTNALFLCYANGRWFFATDQNASGTPLGIVQVATLFSAGVPSLFGFTGAANGGVYALFSDSTKSLPATIQPRAWDFGNAILTKNLIRLGIEGSFPNATTVTCTATAYNQSGQSSAQSVTLPTTPNGFGLLYGDAQQAGKYIGLSITLTAINWQISGFHLEYSEGTAW